MPDVYPTNSGTLFIAFIPAGSRTNMNYEVFLGSLGNNMGTFPTEEAAVQYCETLQQAWN